MIRPVLAALVLHLVLIQPNHPAAVTPAALGLFPLELPAILLALAAAGPRLAGALRVALVAALGAIAVLKAADMAMFIALARGFNPVADMPLVAALLRLSAGAIGVPATVAAVVGAVAAVAGLVAALWWATGVWARIDLSGLARPAAACGAVLAALVVTAEIGHTMGAWSLPARPPGAAFTARVGVERMRTALTTLRDLRRFAATARADTYRDRRGLLGAIDRDTIVIFVESYGRASLDTALYADTHRATLARAEARLGARGLAMRSGFLQAPTRGGQSWLSHESFARGLWIDNQMRYGAALASGRETLFHIARRSGFRTAAVMPAITLDWPESARMGFDTVLAAKDLGYRGDAFNWVTMPDQFALAALDRLLRADARAQPLFAQVALVSSHAPWVPVPELVPWEDLGDGRIFTPMARAGDPPEVVWRDRDRVREQYRRAVDYALRAVFAYAARQDPAPLLFVLGDHQAARFVALDDRPDVPVHVIGPNHLVARVAGWGWAPGLIPDADTAPIPMDRMRDMILDAFSDTRGES